MTYPIQLFVYFDFSSGPNFDPPFQIGISQLGINKMGSGGAAGDVVDLTSQTAAINIRRGRDFLQDKFNAGTCSVRVYDPNGDWSPENPASPYFGKLQPLRKLRIVGQYLGVDYPLFAGYTTAYNYSYPKNEEIGYIDIQATDAFTLFNKSAITTVTGATAGETTGSRIGDILTTIGFPTSQRDVDTGNITVQADPGTLRSVLEALQTVEFTEFGALYMSADGKVVFRQRTDAIEALGETPTEFDPQGTIPYKDIKMSFDDKLVFNVANFKRVGGTTQTVTNQTSIDTYFPHTITREELLHETDAATLDLAKAYVSARKDTTIRIDAMSLDLTTPNYSAGIIAALGLDFLDAVRITNYQPGGSTLIKDLQIFGVQHQITPRSWITTFATGDPLITGFIIGNSTYGKLGVSTL
jgi:hypothetical protein